MKFRKLRVSLLRIRLEKNGFYDDIIFEEELVRKRVKRVLTNWIINLQESKHIKVKKFKDLFSKGNDIVFPIKIIDSNSRYSLGIEFFDNAGKAYYVNSNYYYDLDRLQNYTIERVNSFFGKVVDRVLNYKICKDKGIMLIGSKVTKLNINGTEKDIVLDFRYDHEKNITEVTLKSCESAKKIRIKYPIINDELDQKVLKFLLNSHEVKNYYYNVFPILEFIVTAIPDEKVTIFITSEIEEEIYSEIEVVNSYVQKYTISKIINEGEIQINKKVLAKKLKKFLKENNDN